MMKKYLDINVYDAAIQRLEWIFDNIPQTNIYLAFSAGKDSTVMLNLALKVAREKNKLPLNVMTLDMEAMYSSTHDCLVHYMTSPEINPVWLCLPFGYRNAVSMFQPNWTCWDLSLKYKWVREMPNFPFVKNDLDEKSEFRKYGFRKNLRPSSFWIKYAQWFYHEKANKDYPVVALIGIRSDESLNRYRVVASDRKTKIEEFQWTTKAAKDLKEPIYNAYPIYDMRTEDIWKAMFKDKMVYNEAYNKMFLAGRSLDDMRICQPYGDDQRKGLDLFHLLEPETWALVVERVMGANMGSIYKDHKILGNGRIAKPEHLTWKEYYLFLMSTLPEELMQHYKRMCEVTISNWIKGGKIKSEEEISPTDGSLVSGHPSYARFCKMILRNDFKGYTLKFSGRKGDVDKFNSIAEKYKNLL